jgi:hypothetical protein
MIVRRRWIGNLLLIAGGVAAALVMAELALRIFMPKPDFYVYDSHTGWNPNPGSAGWDNEESRVWLEFNRDGFRGPAVPFKKPPGTFRVVVLGDSFTEAQQVPWEDTFCAVMQHELSGCPSLQGRRIEVIDLGCDGYGTAQELIVLRRVAWKLHPDMVVLAFFSGNDVRNNEVALEGDKCRPFFIYRRGELTLDGPFNDSSWFRWSCMARFDARHFRVLDVLGNARDAIRDWTRGKAPSPVRGHEPGISDMVYRPPATPLWKDAWRVTDGEIVEIHQEVERNGATFLLATLSTGIQVYPDPEVRARYQKFVGVPDLFYPERHLKALGDSEGFQVLNLAPVMQQWAEQHHAFLHGFKAGRTGTGHWNVTGHRLAGNLLAGKICTIAAAAPSAHASPGMAKREGLVITSSDDAAKQTGPGHRAYGGG